MRKILSGSQHQYSCEDVRDTPVMDFMDRVLQPALRRMLKSSVEIKC